MFRFASSLQPEEEGVDACEEAVDVLKNGDLSNGGTGDGLLPDDDDGSLQKSRVDFEEALRETEDLLLRFLQNSYVDAIEEISSKAHLHFTYMQGKANFLILKAIVTLDPEEIEVALKACQEAIDACHEARRKQSWFTSWFWKTDPNDFTDEEIHAELGYAETTILMALLICITERTIVGLVKAGFKIQTSMGAFLECRRILKERTSYCSEDSKAHFESGVRMGIGAYNVITSHLPNRILSLVSFMGMGGNRSYGLKQAEKAAFMEKGIRAPLAGLGLLGYHIKVEFLLGLGEVDFEYVGKLIDHMSKRIEGSALLTIFSGMYEEALGHPKEAIVHYEAAMTRIQYWVQAHHGCHWLLLWCYAVQRQWDKCTEKIKILLDECRWSPATFNYMYAMFLYMEQEQRHGQHNRDKFDPDVMAQISHMMSLVPGIRHRIAGKTVHLEKFVELRSYLFFNEKETMLQPILDMFYLWNIFPMMQKNPALLEPFLKDVEDNLLVYPQSSSEEWRHRYYYLIFYKGVCKRYMGDIEESINCFREVIACEADIKEYTHLPPHACLELGLVYRKLDDLEEAKFWLNKAIYDYANYMNATTVHIRAHTALTIIRTQEGQQENMEAVYAQFEDKLKQMSSRGVTLEETEKAATIPDAATLEVEDLS